MSNPNRTPTKKHLSSNPASPRTRSSGAAIRDRLKRVFTPAFPPKDTASIPGGYDEDWERRCEDLQEKRRNSAAWESFERRNELERVEDEYLENSAHRKAAQRGRKREEKEVDMTEWVDATNEATFGPEGEYQEFRPLGLDLNLEVETAERQLYYETRSERSDSVRSAEWVSEPPTPEVEAPKVKKKRK